MSEGKPLAEFWTDASAESSAGLSGANPAYWENVYRTNVQTSYNAGRAAEFMATNPEYLEFLGIEDSRQTSICRERSGVILPATHPFWSSNWPPLHFQCRSTVRAVYRHEIESLRSDDPNWKPTDEESLSSLVGTSEGFGENPIDTGSFYALTPKMVQRAEQYGIMDDIKVFAKELGIKYYRITPITKVSKITVGSGAIIPAKESTATVPKFATQYEAEKWIVNADLADACSFKGFDLKVVQELVEGLNDDISKFPKARKSLQFFGSIKERNDRIRDYWIKKRTSAYTAVGYDEKRAVVLARKEIDKALRKNGYIPGPENIAQYAPMEGFKGIAFNEKYASNYEFFKMSIEQDMLSGNFPKGTGSIIAVERHEMGHALDHITGLSKDSTLLLYWRSLSNAEIRSGLSGYATKKIEEFIAEAWAEYTVSPSPRPIAMKVGGMMIDLLNRR